MAIKTWVLPINLIETKKINLAVGLSIVVYFVSVLLGHPQFLVGTIVNASLFTAAILLPKKYFWPILILPSIGVLSRGIIFGPLTPFLVYFLPFIWISNFILIISFKNFYEKIGFLKSMIIASLLKQILLFISAQIYFDFKLVPKMFLQTMGILQLLTALLGGFIIYVLWIKVRRQKN